MITVVHGDDLINSRKRLDWYKDNAGASQVIQVEGASLDLTTLTQLTRSDQLFADTDQKLVIVERFLYRGISQQFFDWLKSNKQQINVIFWEDRSLDRRSGKAEPLIAKLRALAPDVQIDTYKDSLMFNFLESLYPGNLSPALALGRKLARRYDFEEWFPMLTDHFRQLMLASLADQESLDLLHPYRKAKIQNLSGKFTPKKLLRLYQMIFWWETAVKLARLEHLEQVAALDQMTSVANLYFTDLDSQIDIERFILAACQVD